MYIILLFNCVGGRTLGWSFVCPLLICSRICGKQIFEFICDINLPHRVQNLDSIVRQADRDLPVVNTRGDVLFNSWKGIFNGQGGFFSQAPRIYSFSGKNVLTDPLW